MDSALKHKLIEEIGKSGFPLELEVIDVLRSNNYLTFSNLTFEDSLGSINELDVFSILFDEETEWEIGPSGIQLIIECKKTEKYPWIFFKEAYNPLHLLGMLFKVDYSTDIIDGDSLFNPLLGYMHTELGSHHYNDRSIPVARTYFEAFKKPSEQTTIYKAVNNILKDRQFVRSWFANSISIKGSRRRTFLNHYVIVLDGPLYLANKEENNFDIEETKHLFLIVFDTLQKQQLKLLEHELIIEVVTKDYFPEFLKLIKFETIALNKHLKKIASNL